VADAKKENGFSMEFIVAMSDTAYYKRRT